MEANNIQRTKRVNSVIISGTVGAENSIYRNEKNTVCTFSFAQYAGKDDKGNEQTIWHKVKAFAGGKNPVDLNIIAKGEKLILHGHFDAETFENKEKKSVTRPLIVADQLEVNVPVEYAPVEDNDLPAGE